MIFFWSDTHFNHAKCIEFCDRRDPGGERFQCAQDMNEELLYRWNTTVSPRDTVWFLGDFGFNTKVDGHSLDLLFHMLHGHKHLVVGNHDERNKQVLRLGWESVSTLKTVKQGEMRAEVCHYPLESWKKSHRGALMIHGHCHGSLSRTIPHRFDVGCDVRKRPVSFEVLWSEASQQQWEPNDHHVEASL